MLKNRLQNDLKDALLLHEEQKLSTLRMLLSAIQYTEINKGPNYSATDEDIQDVIAKEVKKRREAIDLYEKGGRPELAAKEKQEMEILQAYLPEQMSKEKIGELVEDAISQTGAKSIQDMGKVMGMLMPKVKGRIDAGVVNAMVREKLS